MKSHTKFKQSWITFKYGTYPSKCEPTHVPSINFFRVGVLTEIPSTEMAENSRSALDDCDNHEETTQLFIYRFLLDVTTILSLLLLIIEAGGSILDIRSSSNSTLWTFLITTLMRTKNTQYHNIIGWRLVNLGHRRE